MPNNELSIIAESKITDYLLSNTPPIGKHKANFFSRFGFCLSEIETFRNALLQHSHEREIETNEETEYGNKYKLKCEFQTPDNINPCIVTVWIIENGDESPKLITAYSGE